VEPAQEDKNLQKKLEFIDEIKNRVNNSKNSGRDICKQKMAQMLENAAKNTCSAREKIRQQIENLRNKEKISYQTNSTNYESQNENFVSHTIKSKGNTMTLKEENSDKKEIDNEDLLVIKALNEQENFNNNNEKEYDDSLFNIIDEIEASEKSTQKEPLENEEPEREQIYEQPKKKNSKRNNKKNVFESKVYYPRVQTHTLYGYK